MSANRNFKDTVFTRLFSESATLLERKSARKALKIWYEN